MPQAFIQADPFVTLHLDPDLGSPHTCSSGPLPGVQHTSPVGPLSTHNAALECRDAPLVWVLSWWEGSFTTPCCPRCSPLVPLLPWHPWCSGLRVLGAQGPRCSPLSRLQEACFLIHCQSKRSLHPHVSQQGTKCLPCLSPRPCAFQLKDCSEIFLYHKHYPGPWLPLFSPGLVSLPTTPLPYFPCKGNHCSHYRVQTI